MTETEISIPGYKVQKCLISNSGYNVYSGVRESDGQPVALKVVGARYPKQTDLVRLRHEYEITDLLSKVPSVLSVHSLSSLDNGLLLCLHRISGETLTDWMQDRKFELEERLELALSITAAVNDVHGAQVIHKDINPDNILVTAKSASVAGFGVKLTNFSLASQITGLPHAPKKPEALEGTLAYMSPEQTGRMNRAIDYRSDFYSLGVTLYQLLTGRLPFDFDDPLELVHAHIAHQPQTPVAQNPDVPEMVSRVVLKLLAKTAEDRYQNGWGVRADLTECLEQLRRKGNIDTFQIASQDVPETFQVSQELYGRDQEITVLLTAYERIAVPSITSSTGAELFLIGGYSGIGKSVLVRELYRVLEKRSGYLITGKFDQYQRDIPYYALKQAIAALIKQLLTESDARLGDWRARLLEAMGTGGQVLIDVVPELELIIGPQPVCPELGPTENQNRLNSLFQNFLAAFCSQAFPLVIFFDDMQWADSATLEFLETILPAHRLGHLLVICAYRDNEVDPGHRFMRTVEHLRKANVTINAVTLSPLSSKNVNQLIADSLFADTTRTQPLAELVMRKTQGNPFFTIQFLNALYERGLLAFQGQRPSASRLQDQATEYGWQWDITAIEGQDITDNVVELMLGRLKKLPPNACDMLSLAACIGGSFDLRTLSVVSGHDLTQAWRDLMPALREGFLVPLSGLEYSGANPAQSALAIYELRFLHDRVQQAAYALICKCLFSKALRRYPPRISAVCDSDEIRPQPVAHWPV